MPREVSKMPATETREANKRRRRERNEPKQNVNNVHFMPYHNLYANYNDILLLFL